ncbi:hypothetical protein EFQ80_11655 [Shigella sonnei]|nr:hypothetical protein [Shigella sonnei]
MPQSGLRNPGKTKRTTRASVFFCVYIPAHIRIMVAQVGLTSVGPVSSFTGIANPAWATTNKEIRNSGGSTTN